MLQVLLRHVKTLQMNAVYCLSLRHLGCTLLTERPRIGQPVWGSRIYWLTSWTCCQRFPEEGSDLQRHHTMPKWELGVEHIHVRRSQEGTEGTGQPRWMWPTGAPLPLRQISSPCRNHYLRSCHNGSTTKMIRTRLPPQWKDT